MDKKFFCLLALLLFLVNLVSAQSSWPTDYAGMRSKAINFAGRLLCLLQVMTAPVALILLVIGGLKFIAADDPGEVLAARKMVLDAVIGAFCVIFFLAAATALGVPVYCS